MADSRDVKAVQKTLAWLERGIITQQEVIGKLAMSLTGESIDDVFETVSPECQHLLQAGHREALQRRADEDCLQPEHSPFDDISQEYHCRVAELLLAPPPGEPPWSQFTAVCLPSFQPESALRMVRPRKGFPTIREPTLVLVSANESIWGPTIRSVETTRYTRAVQNDLASRLEILWEQMLLTTRASRHIGTGVDGVTFHFTFGHKAGRTWSPRPDTRVGRFVEVASTLVRYTTADEIASPGIEAELLAQLDWFMF